MPESVLFVTGKDPYSYHSGDTAVTRMLVDAVSDMAEVRMVAYSGDGRREVAPIPVTYVAKPRPRMSETLVKSLLTRKSLVHTRFSSPPLVEAVKLAGATATRIVAEHPYMSEAIFAAGYGDRVYVNTHVLEAQALRARETTVRRLVLRAEAARIWRDELRCLRNACGVVTLDHADSALLRSHGIESACIDIIFSPKPRFAPSQEQNVLFVGDRRWPPNLQAAASAERIFASVTDALPDATLTVVGQGPNPDGRPPARVIRKGFVPSLDAEWAACRVLFAPIAVGGGVRIKILDAACRGVPVVTTTPGAGMLASLLPIDVADSHEDLASCLQRYLRDQSYAEERSIALWEANRVLWQAGRLREQVAEWLGL